MSGPFAYGEKDVWMVLEASRGDGSMGDIAIDDVDLYHGRCMTPRKRSLLIWKNFINHIVLHVFL